MNSPQKASIVSGYFSPLHPGHLRLFESARERSGYLIVIVNNDAQQILKKGRVIQRDRDRVLMVRALRVVDDVVLGVDNRRGIDKTFDLVRSAYPGTSLEFCNGGDQTDVDLIPEEEVEAAKRNGITMSYGIGGTEKVDSSSRILEEMDAAARRQS